MSIIGMTALPEARLAREAEICYATLAMVTDYDTWHPDHDSVTVDMVVQTLNKNVHLARNTVSHVISTIADSRACSCGSALQSAIMTAPEMVPADVKQQMRPLIGRYVE
jgi:5'-methylthioadenosine phosphorylase